MPILTAADKPTYFPSVIQTGADLDGLMLLAQSLCESSYGANRPLELQQHTEIVTVVNWVATLTYYPIVPPLVSVSARLLRDVSFGRTVLHQWLQLGSDEYLLDVEVNQLRLGGHASEVKVTYSAGLDFSTSNIEVQKIKAIAGQIVTYYGNYRVGLDSYLLNPAGDGDVISYNLAPMNSYLSGMLQPLRKYLPRRSGG